MEGANLPIIPVGSTLTLPPQVLTAYMAHTYPQNQVIPDDFLFQNPNAFLQNIDQNSLYDFYLSNYSPLYSQESPFYETDIDSFRVPLYYESSSSSSFEGIRSERTEKITTSPERRGHTVWVDLGDIKYVAPAQTTKKKETKQEADKSKGGESNGLIKKGKEKKKKSSREEEQTPSPSPSKGLAGSNVFHFEAVRDIDPNKVPQTPLPPPQALPPADQAGKAFCSEEELETYKKKNRLTEAQAQCIDCTEKQRKASDRVQSTIRSMDRGKHSFEQIIRNLCNRSSRCYGLDVNNFIHHIEKRAGDSSIPPALMFAVMFRESAGVCKSRSGSSKGLFQINEKDSTVLSSQCDISKASDRELMSACENLSEIPERQKKKCFHQKHRSQCRKFLKSPAPGLTCLKNPYCNLEEALFLFSKDKWNLNKKLLTEKNKDIPLPQNTDWLSLSKQERDMWRAAVSSYNSNSRLRSAMRKFKKENPAPGDADLYDFENLRKYWMRSFKHRPRRSDVRSLAYVQRIAGREVHCGLNESLIGKWMSFRQKNPGNISCPARR